MAFARIVAFGSIAGIRSISAIATFAQSCFVGVNGNTAINAPRRIYLTRAANFRDPIPVIAGFCASRAFQAVVLF
jgi:hypothetical protein